MARYEKEGRLARLQGGRAVPALGAQRRLQALMRLGWSSHRIAAAAGLSHRNHVWRIVNGQKGKPTVWIQRDTAEWVSRVYDELSMQIPTGRYVNRTRAYAERMGWPVPLAWDDIDNDPEPADMTPRRPTDVDPVVVDLLLAGRHVPSTKAERDEAMDRWLRMGNSERSLCNMHGWRKGRYGRRAVLAEAFRETGAGAA
jgi:hypothetical protein